MKRVLAFISIFFVFVTVVSASEAEPLSKKYVNWSYGKTGEFLTGYIPALDATVVRPWQLAQWKAIFHFPDSSTTMNNYDVFNVKNKPEDINFNKENGLGLVYKSEDGLSDLFNEVMKNQVIEPVQLNYFKNKFISSASDPKLGIGSEFYYKVDNREFLRISGVIQRMGAAFDRTEIVTDSDRRAHYKVSDWPEMKVTVGNRLGINFTASGYSNRYITLYAIPKGKFPDMTYGANLFDGQELNTSVDKYTDNIQVSYSLIPEEFGNEVDIILDDGYGRTAIQTVKIPEQPLQMDYVPISLSLTEAGQLWMKFRYEGDDFNIADYVNGRGIPMDAAVKIGGAITAEFSMPTMYSGLPQIIENQKEFSVMLGKIDVGTKPGKYYIKVTALVNNPNHPDRAYEAPAEAYKNNQVKGEWVLDIGAPSNDLIAQSVEVTPKNIKVGQQTTISAKVKNAGTSDENNVLIRFYANQNMIYEARKNLPAGKTVVVGGFSWTGSQTGVHNISVHVDPLKEKVDSDRSNNIAVTGCSVGGSGGSGESCTKTSSTNNWSVAYRLITGYPTKTAYYSWTDSDGKSHTGSYSYTDYSDPIWETRNVTYNENLKVSAEVNTKQGIATDPKNPKASDRESRGSWEIIPYSKKNGLDPNTVTRAGYGFELKVTTNYQTDWETKVPIGLEGTAKKIGGEYVGPKAGEVIAKIYNTKGQYVESVTLERTSGNNVGTATWELPKKSHKFSDGETVQERKYYTNKDWADGNFNVVIVVTASGSQGQLVVCSTEKLRIYGSMYDDSQNIRQK